MKFIKILALVFIGFSFTGCDAIQKATNSTGSAFSLTGKWTLNTNTPENVLVGSVVTVTPLLSEGRLSTMTGSGNCFRQSDVVWKSIASDNAGGFTISNLVSGCSGLNFQPASIYVMNANEIRITGKNASGQELTQVWQRVK